MNQHQGDPKAQEIATVRTALADLRGWYVRLFGITGTDGRSPTAEARGGGSNEPPVPVNLEVLDLICRVERDVDKVERFGRRVLLGVGPAMRRDTRNRAGDVRDAAGLVRVPVPSTGNAPRYAWLRVRPEGREALAGVRPDQRVLDALAWIGDVLPDLLDRGYRSEVVDPVFELRRRARKALGLAERAYMLESECPFCGLASIVARPEKDLVLCGNPACRDDDGRPRIWRAKDYAHEVEAES